MSVAEISHQIQSIGFLTYIRESGYTYPMILSIHLATIAVFGGMILMTDLRILGLAMRSVPVSLAKGYDRLFPARTLFVNSCPMVRPLSIA